ncbi:S4 domain-containing protein YaaA [Aquibacillus albus]|uniref:S4 domain protein YaaA n=1 Tax=Aquibacillus albus TaxID=1168171 RepID=A0ABS2N2Y5_9BACI|nr:S4 domain protein YaaA [Aquibacillus albus]
MNQNIEIKTEFIPLGQFLKLANILESGGMIKLYLADNPVLVNGELENRRGRKLYPGDIVEIEDIGKFTVIKQ